VRCCCISGRTISTDQLNAWMGCKPVGNGFLRPIRQQVNNSGTFEITQQRSITMSTFPGPIINANLFGRHSGRGLGGSDETQNGITAPAQTLFAANLCSCLASYGESHLPSCFLQAHSPLGMRTTKLWERFGKNLSWTTPLRTKEATDLNMESDQTPTGWKVMESPHVSALHPL
jgi:hypothetical protein